MQWTRPHVLPSVIALASACVMNPGHRCEDDAHCLLADDGRCEAEGACSYPDPSCPITGRRYGKWAPGDLANACVPEGSSSTDGSTGMPEDPAAQRGLVPGTIMWEQLHDGAGDGSDRGHALAVDVEGDSFYIAGLVVTDPMRGTDVIVQRRTVATGELEWTWTRSHSHLADEARDLTVAADGSLIAIGTVVGENGDDDVWLSKFAPGDDAPTWDLAYDHDGADDRGQGVTITSDGSIVGVGWTQSPDDEDALFVRADDSGAVEASTAVDLSKGAGTDRLHDVVAVEDDLVVTGFRREGAEDAYNVWTARYDRDLVELSFAEVDPPNSGNANRGIRIARAPDGVVGVAGSLTDKRYLWQHDPTTLMLVDAKEWGDGDLHDEATDVAFGPDGSFVVVGVVGFQQGGTPDDESDDESEWWVVVHGPDSEVRWDTRGVGYVDPPGADRALAVVVVDELAIVTGYRVTDIDTGGKAIRIVAYAL